jgi:excisionase family DNA binding protein
VITLLRLDQVADLLGIGRTTAYAMAAKGDLPVVRVGRQIRVRPEDLEEWLRALSLRQRAMTPTLPGRSRNDGPRPR